MGSKMTLVGKSCLLASFLLGFCAPALAAYNPNALTAPPGSNPTAIYPSLQYVTPQMYGAKCDGSTDDHAALSAANTAANTTGSTLLVQGGTCLITSDLTLTASVKVIKGGVLKPSSTKTLTCNCVLDAGNFQIFDISAGGVIAGTVTAPMIQVGWFNSDSSNSDRQAALQAALNLAAGASIAVYKNAIVSLCGASPSGGSVYNIGTIGVSVSGNDLPNLQGCAPASLGGPDSLNLVGTVGSSGSGYLVTFIGQGSGANCGCGVRNIFFDGSGSGGVDLNAVSGATIAYNAASTVLNNVFVVVDGETSGQFAENNQFIGNFVPGLAAHASFITFEHDAGGGSFAGTNIGANNYVSLNSGARTTGVIQILSGGFPYNSNINLNVHNNGATGDLYVVDNLTSGFLVSFTSGAIQLEGSNSSTLGLVNPSHSRVYFGNVALTEQGFNNVDLSGATFCRSFYFDISLNCLGGVAYQLTSAAAGNTTIPIPNLLGNGSYNTYALEISNADRTYVYDATVVANLQGTPPTTTAPVLVTDTHSYGAPTFSVSGLQLKVANGSWPSGTFTVLYTETSP